MNTTEVVCVECGAVAPTDALGWHACLVGVDDELDDEEEAVVYCPECAEREFDE